MASNRIDVDGYIHDVSENKTAKSGSRFFHFKVQERDTATRVVCFSPEKRSSMKEKEDAKSPVRLLQVSPQKRRYEPEVNEYLMYKYSRLSAQTNLAFPWKDGPQQIANLSIVHIIQNCCTGDLVTIKAHVLSKCSIETVFSPTMQKELKKCEVIIADSSGAIPLSVWEETIDKIDVGKSYLFSHVRLSFFKKKFLNSTKDSDVTALEEEVSLSKASYEAAEVLKPKEKLVRKFAGSILGVELNRSYVCLNCKSRIYIDDQKCALIVKCSSCKLSMKKSSIRENITANMMIAKEDGENAAGRYHCSMSVLKSLFLSLVEAGYNNISNGEIVKLSSDLIEETMLVIEKVSFTINEEEKIVEWMQIFADDKVE